MAAAFGRISTLITYSGGTAQDLDLLPFHTPTTDWHAQERLAKSEALERGGVREREERTARVRTKTPRRSPRRVHHL